MMSPLAPCCLRRVHAPREDLRQRKAKAVARLQRRGPALQRLLGERRGRGHRDDLARSGRIEIERGKDLAQRLHRRSVQLAAVMDVEGGGAARREPLLDQGVELARQQVERDVAATVGVEQDEVVEIAAAIEKHAAVAGPVAHALGLAQAEIGLGGGDDTGIDFHRGDHGLGHEAPEIGRDRAAAEPEHEDSPRRLGIDGRDRHDLRIAQRQVVGIEQVGDRFGVVPAFDLKRHHELVLPLGDEDVVVFGFDVGEAPVRALEHVRADAVVDQAFGPARRTARAPPARER